MEISKPPSPTLSPKTNKTFAVLFLAFGVLGFSDSTYLFIEHLRGVLPSCYLISGCDRVLLSPYAEIFGVPVALLGVLYYGIIVAGSLLFFDIGKSSILKYLSLFSIAGIIASGYFVFLQLFVIKSICLYCVLSAVSSTVLFVIGMIFLVQSAKYKVQS